MSAKCFKSKVDHWIFLILVAVIVINGGVIGMIALDGGDPLASTIIILVLLLVMALIMSIMFSTHYTVDRGILRIASGPYRFKVPINQITSVKASRSPLSSPALSMERLLIRHGKRRRIMVSPADKAGFLDAIGHKLSG